VFLYLVLSKVNVESIGIQINKANYVWISIAVIIIGMNYAIRAFRWWIILGFESKDLSFAIVLKYFIIGNALNNVLPLRAGDVYRVVNYANVSGLKAGSVLASVAIERIYDILSLLILLWIGLTSHNGVAILDQFPTDIQDAIYELNILAILGVVVTILTPKYVQKILNFFYLRNLLPKRLYSFFNEALEALQNSLTLRRQAMLFLISITAWTIEACSYGAILKSLSITLPINAMFVSNTFATLSTLLPSSPGYVGTFHYFLMLSLAPFNVSAEVAIGFALIMHFVLWTSITSFGLIAYFIPRKFSNKH
jgi:uncharacterized protein (TIRG00374 family)